jgi:zinc protease
MILSVSIFSCTQPAKAPVEKTARSIEKAAEGPFDYEVMTLDNGMRVVTLEDHSCPIAAVQVWYHVGSKNEQPDKRGFAHMFEHMMFRGTNRLKPEEHFDYIRQTGGDCNAGTSFDQTVYIQEVPSNQVEMVLWLESERMAFLKVDEEGYAIERNVVAEEYRMGAEQPYGTLLDKLLPQIFPNGTYSWSVIGNMQELAASTVDDLQDFWETYYVPNNATLVVVGDITHDQIQDLAGKYFGWIPSYPDPPPLAVPPAPMNTEPLKILIEEKKGPVPILAVGYRTVPTDHPDSLYLEMLGAILGGSESSRLYKRLILEEECAMIAMAGAMGLEREGVFGAGAVLNPLAMVNPFNTDKADSMKAIREEIQRIKAEGPTDQELLKAKNNALRSAVTSQLTVASKANVLGNATMILKDPSDVNRRFERIRAVTRDDLLRVANTYLLDEREIEIEIKPSVVGFLLSQLKGDKEKESATLEESEKTAAKGDAAPTGKPGLEAIRPAAFGDTPPSAPLLEARFEEKVETLTLENGLKVVAIPNHEVPFVTYNLGLECGAYTDPEDAPGTASMAAGMITRGTEKHTYEELAEILDTYAISISGSVGMDAGMVNASAVTDQAERAMRYMAEAVTTPTFPEKQFKIARKQKSTGKAIEEKSPEFLADRELRRRLYGDHPYARSADGEMADLDRITPAGMKRWWRDHVQPSTSVLYVVGDIKARKAIGLAAKYFGTWSSPEPFVEPDLPPIPEPSKTQIYLVDQPGDQVQIRVGQVGITRKHPDFFTTRVLNDVFGDGFNSRLNKTIRVDMGLTYGARGGFRPGRFSGRFVASTFTKNESVGEAVKAILNEIQRLKDEPPTEEEMQMAKSHLLGSMVLRRETPQSVAAEHWLIEYEHLPPDYMRQYLDRVRETKPSAISRTAKELIDGDKLVIVVVGHAEAVKAQLGSIASVSLQE